MPVNWVKIVDRQETVFAVSLRVNSGINEVIQLGSIRICPCSASQQGKKSKANKKLSKSIINPMCSELHFLYIYAVWPCCIKTVEDGVKVLWSNDKMMSKQYNLVITLIIMHVVSLIIFYGTVGQLLMHAFRITWNPVYPPTCGWSWL